MSEAAQPVPPARSLAARASWWPASRGWLLWAAFALVVAVNKFSEPPNPDNVFQMYRDAAICWLHGQPLYNGTGCGVIYLPQAYLLFMPLAGLPFDWGGAVWRIVNIGLFAAGVWQLTRLLSPRLPVAHGDRLGSGVQNSILAGEQSAGWREPMPAKIEFCTPDPSRRLVRRHVFFGVSLAVALLSWSSARHGQMTLAMGGMMMLATADLVDQRWWRATLWLLLGVALKPLSVVLLLLAAVLYPRVSWRLLVGGVLLFGLPFLAQRPSYVWQQYVACVAELGRAADVGDANEFAQAFSSLKTLGVDIPEGARTVIRLAAAAVTLAAGWWICRRQPRAQAGLLVFTLAAAYLMLFNPRTERNTYCLLAPSLALFTAQAVIDQQRARAALYLGLIGLFLVSHPLGNLLTGGPTVWIKPLLCAIFLAAIFQGLWRQSRHERGRTPSSDDPQPILLPLSAHRRQVV
jgi:hypothetical protein